MATQGRHPNWMPIRSTPVSSCQNLNTILKAVRSWEGADHMKLNIWVEHFKSLTRPLQEMFVLRQSLVGESMTRLRFFFIFKRKQTRSWDCIQLNAVWIVWVMMSSMIMSLINCINCQSRDSLNRGSLYRGSTVFLLLTSHQISSLVAQESEHMHQNQRLWDDWLKVFFQTIFRKEWLSCLGSTQFGRTDLVSTKLVECKFGRILFGRLLNGRIQIWST